jgi:hypothetical protein
MRLTQEKAQLKAVFATDAWDALDKDLTGC